MTFFRKNISIFTPKNSDDLFLVIGQVFLIFTSLFRFSVSLLCQMSYMTLSSQEKPLFLKKFLDDTYFFTLFVLSRPSDNTILLKILGGPMHGPSPTSNFGGPPPSPLGLRPPDNSVHMYIYD